ncbi:TPA_asm: DUF1310 family protein [Listeria monocytogenes]|uniref:DUF1310 domain-containing protein n=1 Tax=Listeria monocytogenes TaxID=1639 RepID=UPI0008735BDE|nr:DUF1310 domain-containing protein [Listeria monocytogenes]EAF4504538.1 DUF1310 family protein [Listeria monocytogenes serotype 4b]EAF4523235.1 DUF1310 family protein [Listeria monocytogenes serotype 1/2a]EHC6164851.1 DUF1310 domain-containing protein [Listeria monocytogenes serotype 1/2b]AQP78127.1 hypothetical protein B0X25_14985 [Listeria monocytogenes]ARJ88099.1 hypothetical protein Y255_14490 [Listeria monocytogenes]
MKKRWIIVLGMTVITIFGLGVKFYMDEEKLNKEMMNVVYSDEAKKVFEVRLKAADADAFTEKGVIKSYEIDQKSIKKNPMGGINVTLIINGNSELYIKYTMTNFNGELSGGASVTSGNLDKLLMN